MRALVATGLILLALTVLPTPADAREVACVDAVRDSCPGFYCLDTNLNGRFDGGECMVFYCLVDGCCGGAICPPPEW